MISPISVCREAKAGSKKRSRARSVNSALVSAALGIPLRTVILAICPPLSGEDSALCASRAAGNRLQGLHVPGRGRQGLAFDGAVVADQLLAARGQHGPAARATAGLGR